MHVDQHLLPAPQVRKEIKLQQERRAVSQPLQQTRLTEDAAGPPSTAEGVPQQISGRILRRVLLFSGLPTLAGVLSLPLFYYLKVG
jgi:hypothetical protein